MPAAAAAAARYTGVANRPHVRASRAARRGPRHSPGTSPHHLRQTQAESPGKFRSLSHKVSEVSHVKFMQDLACHYLVETFLDLGPFLNSSPSSSPS